MGLPNWQISQKNDRSHGGTLGALFSREPRRDWFNALLDGICPGSLPFDNHPEFHVRHSIITSKKIYHFCYSYTRAVAFENNGGRTHKRLSGNEKKTYVTATKHTLWQAKTNGFKWASLTRFHIHFMLNSRKLPQQPSSTSFCSSTATSTCTQSVILLWSKRSHKLHNILKFVRVCIF